MIPAAPPRMSMEQSASQPPAKFESSRRCRLPGPRPECFTSDHCVCAISVRQTWSRLPAVGPIRLGIRRLYRLERDPRVGEISRRMMTEDLTMIVEQFDRQTMARMEVALDGACEHFACGGKHNVRKRVAQSIIRCAKAGNTSLDALTEAGERALALPSHHSGGRPQFRGTSTRPVW